jgi:hypothetical protein
MSSTKTNRFFGGLALTAAMFGCDDSQLQEFEATLADDTRDREVHAPTDFEFFSDDRRLVIDQTGTALSGSYQAAASGPIIRFETQRGEPTPEEILAVDPSVPAHEIIVRFLDEDGDVFILVGGDAPVDESHTPRATIGDRLEHFRLARAVAEELADVQFPDEFIPEQQILVDAGLLVTDDFLHADTIPAEHDRAVDSDTGVGLGRVGEITTPPSEAGSWTHYAQIRRKGAWDVNLVDHSALLLYTYYNNSLVAWRASSNHGTVASSGTMTTKCGSSWGGRSTQWPPWREDACYTPYGVHVCNNDTYMQYAMARDQADISGWNWRCYGLMPGAPSCY